MKKELSTNEKQLFDAVDEILWKKWDPIGVNDTPEARNEYEKYVPHIFRLAVEGASETRISQSLILTIETNMGLGGDKDHNSKVAKEIVNAMRRIFGNV